MTTVEIVLHGKKVQIERLPDGRFKKPDFVKEMMQYGTSLKPAFEPVVVARAPRGKHTYAALARTFGTGALAIDAGRIPANGDVIRSSHNVTIGGNGIYQGGKPFITGDPNGKRWPANFGLICACEGDDHADDCPVSVLGRQSGETRLGHFPRSASNGGIWGNGKTPKLSGDENNGYEDRGSAARFFYQAKAAAWERHWPVKSNHPTVKPIRLAAYLARLILPPELDTPRRLLVPFAGSGSEMIGARLAGWDVVTGIERESEYVALAEARLAWWAQFASYDDARAAYEKERKAKPALVVIEDKPEQIARTGR